MTSRLSRWGRACMLLAGLSALAPVLAQTSPKVPQGSLLPKDSVDASTFRGGLVFANYCVTCHGINADGNGRAARLYNPKPANLRASDKNDSYFGLIIRKGGAALGRSEFMPSWEAELTNEQIADLVSYLRSINVAKN
jgi:mono/diheme cytochrome c family protein